MNGSPMETVTPRECWDCCVTQTKGASMPQISPGHMSAAGRNPHFPLQNHPITWDFEALLLRPEPIRSFTIPSSASGPRSCRSLPFLASLAASSLGFLPDFYPFCLWRGSNCQVTAIALNIQTPLRCPPSAEKQWLALPTWGRSLRTETA